MIAAAKLWEKEKIDLAAYRLKSYSFQPIQKALLSYNLFSGNAG